MSLTYPVPPVWQRTDGRTHVRVYVVCLADLTGYADDEGRSILIVVCDDGAHYETITTEVPTGEVLPERVRRVCDAVFGPRAN